MRNAECGILKFEILKCGMQNAECGILKSEILKFEIFES